VLHFGAVSLAADVTLNGRHIGDHRGGFAAFNFDVTDAIRWGAPNVLAVHVSNEADPDLSPLAGDFTIYGGIYRPVLLWVLDPIHIDVLDYASPGVFLSQQTLDANHAVINIRSEVANDSAVQAHVTLIETILDSKQQVVVAGRQSLSVASKAIRNSALSLRIRHPHRWDGVADPYLYTVRVDVMRHGQLLDRVVQPLGLRTESVDRNRGFILNGRAMQIRGVCLHQEGATHGWAVTTADEERDMRLIRDMGVNGIRLAHYQHSQSFLDLADRTGMLIWAELAQVDHVSSSARYRDNIRQQLIELIRQNYNHPSIFVWSLYNELNSPTKEAAIPLVLELNKLAHSEDPDRPTSGAGSGDTMEHLHSMVEGLDLIAMNDYPGWYIGNPADMGQQIEQQNKAYGQRGLGVTEYGAGASIHQHMLDVTKEDVQIRGWFHPEEWQAIVHEGNYAEIRKRPSVWGAFVWNMFDFSSARRREGDTGGMNDKGLVTRDRNTRKDAYFFYQANWTDIPMAHLVGCGVTSSKGRNLTLKAYSNKPALSLTVNGKSYGIQNGSEAHVFLWRDVSLDEGTNHVSVSDEHGLEDHCSIALTVTPSPSRTSAPSTQLQ
jgi:beta-galactosidase